MVPKKAKKSAPKAKNAVKAKKMVKAKKTVKASPADAPWRQAVKDELPALGHRNWVVIADSAYPEQSRKGIKTVVTGAGQTQVVKAVLDAVSHSIHVRPIVYLDAELPFVAEEDAPGVTGYREELDRILESRPVSVLPHEEIIARLDDAAKVFSVLILKTNLSIPYTSVFVQLDCGYWSAEAEQKLRAAIKAARKK